MTENKLKNQEKPSKCRTCGKEIKSEYGKTTMENLFCTQWCAAKLGIVMAKKGWAMVKRRTKSRSDSR